MSPLAHGRGDKMWWKAMIIEGVLDLLIHMQRALPEAKCGIARLRALIRTRLPRSAGGRQPWPASPR